jgi:hypothetical protein
VIEADSLLIYKLKQQAWIPDKEGVFHKPQEITRQELPDSFRYDNANGLMTAIGFGENALKRSQEYQAKNNKARDIGFDSFEDAEEAARILKENKLSVTELKALLAQRKTTEQPENAVPNPERRRKGAKERQENAPSKESITRERKIQPGINAASAKAKAYLRPNYTNPNEELVCQCCKQEMPFKVGETYYFEAVQCIRQLDTQQVENRLALCPTCSAMYQHARVTDDEEIIRRLVDHEAPDDAASVEIPIILAGKDCALRFVGKHWFDLKTLLEG